MKVIHIDMDDTICQFSKAQREALALEPLIAYPQSQYGFFRNLEPMPGAVELVRALAKEFEVHIVTRPSIDNPLCWTEKAEWIRHHLGRDFLTRTTMTSHKHKFIGDYLIDDKLWEGFIGEQILFGSPGFEHWHEVTEYICRKEGLWYE